MANQKAAAADELLRRVRQGEVLNPEELSRLCSGYAKLMRDPRHIQQTPEEWNFVAVSETEAHEAIRYEYLRENRGFVRRAMGWLDVLVGGKTVRERLLAGDEGGLLFGLLENTPKKAPTYELDFLTLYPLFPLPWVAVDCESRRDIIAYLDGFKASPVVIHPMSSRLARHATETIAKRQVRLGYFMLVDFRSAKLKEIVKAFDRWVRSEAKRHKRKITGAASAVPFHLLKYLAALRLSKAGLNREQVRDLAVAHHADLKFESAGHWHRALQVAKARAAHPWDL